MEEESTCNCIEYTEPVPLTISWTQTLISASHGEKPELRDIRYKTVISAKDEKPYSICKENFFKIIEIFPTEIIDPKELELGSSKDAENQTLLQGVSEVTLPIKYEHKATQTTYTRGPREPVKDVKMKDYLNRRIPEMKTDSVSQSEIEIPPGTSHQGAIKKMSKRRKWKKKTRNPITEKTIIDEILNYLLILVFWICEPDFDVEMKDQEAQTIIRYDFRTDSILLDNEIQTELTCEPRYSNSKLLDQYKETKNFMQSWLEECFVKGIEPRIIIDDLLDEIVAKGADRFKYPMREQTIQTVASYRSHDVRDEDVLRKLRISVVVDPLEGSIVVMPLIDNLLRWICDEVSRDARRIIKNIFGSLLQRTIMISFKLDEIREQPKSIEEILYQRRRKIMESMLTKAKQTVATQTGLAGVPEVMKIKEILYSVCLRESTCHCCIPQEESLLKEDTKVLRTQDILLAYNPCYVIATTEEAKSPHLKPFIELTKRKIERPITAQLPTSQCIEEKRDIFNKKINILMTPRKTICARNSISEWTNIMDNKLSRSWSLEDSANSAASDVTTNCMTESTLRSCCGESQSKNISSLQTSKALQILKSTFCIRNSCRATSWAALREHHSPSENANEYL